MDDLHFISDLNIIYTVERSNKELCFHALNNELQILEPKKRLFKARITPGIPLLHSEQSLPGSWMLLVSYHK